MWPINVSQKQADMTSAPEKKLASDRERKEQWTATVENSSI